MFVLYLPLINASTHIITVINRNICLQAPVQISAMTFSASFLGDVPAASLLVVLIVYLFSFRFWQYLQILLLASRNLAFCHQCFQQVFPAAFHLAMNQYHLSSFHIHLICLPDTCLRLTIGQRQWFAVKYWSFQNLQSPYCPPRELRLSALLLSISQGFFPVPAFRFPFPVHHDLSGLLGYRTQRTADFPENLPSIPFLCSSFHNTDLTGHKMISGIPIHIQRIWLQRGMSAQNKKRIPSALCTPSKLSHHQSVSRCVPHLPADRPIPK